MDELDTKLAAILEAEWNEGHDHCEEEDCDEYPQVDESIRQIRQAFADAGYIPSEETGLTNV